MQIVIFWISLLLILKLFYFYTMQSHFRENNFLSFLNLNLFFFTFCFMTQEVNLIQLHQNFLQSTTVIQNKLLLEIRNIYSCRHHACNLYVYSEKSKTCLARDILLQKSDAKKIIFFHLKRSHSEYKVCIIRSKKNIRVALTHTYVYVYMCVSIFLFYFPMYFCDNNPTSKCFK